MKIEQHAINIAQHYEWNGDEIIALMLITLTECNYHPEVKAIRYALAELELNKLPY